jgi:hypothetical protein
MVEGGRIIGGKGGKSGGWDGLTLGTFEGIAGAVTAEDGVGTSQLGAQSGLNLITVPGRRLVGWACRCLINVTWKELKTFPVVVSHKQ